MSNSCLEPNEHNSSLYLKTNPPIESSDQLKADDRCLQCLVCDQWIKDEDIDHSIAISVQKHLLTEHNLMIADIETIADLRTYLDHYRPKFNESEDWNRFCALISTNSGPKDVSQSQTYYMIGGNQINFPEDFKLREEIKDSNLKTILKQLEFERNDTNFKRNCIFCRKIFDGNRKNLFNHLSNDHNFNVGNPDNIVNCLQFLDLLEKKLNQLECLYCRKTFKSWDILKEHMRKKGHKQLHPNNKEYDKYYVINYSSDKNWKELKLERDFDLDNCEDQQWDDWSEESADEHCICLFCPKTCPDINRLKSHLIEIHGFDFDSNILCLEFYLRIKAINYIRRSIYQKKCHKCQQSLATSDELSVHLEFSSHSKQMPDRSQYDFPEYYFSTFEDDNLLHFLDNNEDIQQISTENSSGEQLVDERNGQKSTLM